MSKVFNMVGGGGVTASIFVTGLSETDTVTATKGSKTLTGKWTQNPNPAAHGLPNEYTELEYIEGTGTQYIDTGVPPTQGLGCFLKFKFNDIASNVYLFGAFEANSVRYTPIFTYSGSLVGNKNKTYNDYIYYKNPGDKQVHELKFNVNGSDIEFDGQVVGSVGDIGYSSNIPIYIFSRYYQGVDTLAKANIYETILYSSDGAVVRNYIPAKRNSDSVVGLYDTVGNVFYTNAGTGTFKAGPEVPQTIDGFLIKPIRDFGTWTVTATDGVHTKTQDVLVDVITEYEIEMSLYKLWLYRYGDTFDDVTGGWVKTTTGNFWSYNVGGTVSLNSDHIYVYTDGNKLAFCNTSNKIDISGYQTIKVAYENSIGGSGQYADRRVMLALFSQVGVASTGNYMLKNLKFGTGSGEISMDISSISESAYVAFVTEADTGISANIKAVWLE